MGPAHGTGTASRFMVTMEPIWEQGGKVVGEREALTSPLYQLRRNE